MKNKCIWLVILGLTVAASLRSQAVSSGTQLYVKLFGGYGVLTPGSFRLASFTNQGMIGSTSQSKQGLGTGVRAGGGIGVIVSDFINIGADAEYLAGTSLSSNTNYSSASSYSFISQTKINYTALSIVPHIIFKAVSKPGYLIYNKVGVIVNLPMELKRTEFDSSFSKTANYYYSARKNGVSKIGLTLGLNVALGVQVRVTDKLRAFSELFGNYLVLSPTNYDENRVEINNGKSSTSDFHTKYIKEGETSTTTSGTSTFTTVAVNGNTFNMNALGVNIGLSYRF
jgi:hypothetical protein